VIDLTGDDDPPVEVKQEQGEQDTGAAAGGDTAAAAVHVKIEGVGQGDIGQQRLLVKPATAAVAAVEAAAVEMPVPTHEPAAVTEGVVPVQMPAAAAGTVGAVGGAALQHSQAAGGGTGAAITAGAVNSSSGQQQQQQQQCIDEYLSHERVVRVACAANRSMLLGLNSMRVIAMACMAAPQQQQRTQWHRTVLAVPQQLQHSTA
jgi:hypothetical protein